MIKLFVKTILFFILFVSMSLAFFYLFQNETDVIKYVYIVPFSIIVILWYFVTINDPTKMREDTEKNVIAFVVSIVIWVILDIIVHFAVLDWDKVLDKIEEFAKKESIIFQNLDDQFPKTDGLVIWDGSDRLLQLVKEEKAQKLLVRQYFVYFLYFFVTFTSILFVIAIFLIIRNRINRYTMHNKLEKYITQTEENKKNWKDWNK